MSNPPPFETPFDAVKCMILEGNETYLKSFKDADSFLECLRDELRMMCFPSARVNNDSFTRKNLNIGSLRT